jgi:hypothetical protein
MTSRHRSPALPLLFARLTMASAETILRRSALMAQGLCSPTEYRRMVAEKQKAARSTAAALLRGRTSVAGLLAPWHSAAAANAKRLRRK